MTPSSDLRCHVTACEKAAAGGQKCIPLLIDRPDKIFARRTIKIAGIDCTIERRNNRTLHLYVKPPNGEVLITAPHFYTERQIRKFVEGKADWIRKHQEKMRERPGQSRMALEYTSGETLFFWGRPYELKVTEDPLVKRGKLLLDPEPEFTLSFWGRPYELKVTEDPLVKRGKLLLDPEPESNYSDRAGTEAAPGRGSSCGEQDKDQLLGISGSPVRLEESGLAGDGGRAGFFGKAELIVPAGGASADMAGLREKIVKKRYKELTDGVAEQILDLWSDKTGLRYSSWHSRYMKSRWGSLSVRDKRVCLNTRLAEKPEICLVYVALHEIAHVKVPNHGPDFKAILDRYMPDWRDVEKLLKV